ncbi:MAG: tetratricopeptide repeat protein, partial [bacterium]
MTALKYYMDALTTYRQTDYKNDLADSYESIARLYDKLGRLGLALNNYANAVRVRKENGENHRLINNYFDIGSIYMRLSNYDQALVFFNKALIISQQISDNDLHQKAMRRIGTVYRAIGEYKRALTFLHKASKILEQVQNKNKETQADVLNELSVLYEDLGDYDEALQYLNRTLSLRKEIGDCRDVSHTLNSLGILYSKMGEWNNALRAYEEIECKTLNWYNRFAVKTNSAVVYIKLGKLSEAQEILSKIINEENVGAISSWGDLKNKLGQHDEARRYFLEQIRREEKRILPDPNSLIHAYVGLGEALEGPKKNERAIINYIEAILFVESIRGKLQDQKHKSGFLSKQIRVYGNMCRVLYNLYKAGNTIPESLKKYGNNYADMAFHFAEKAKAHSLVEMLAQARTEKVAHLLPKSLAEKEARLTAYLGNLESQIDQAFEKGKKAQQVLERNIEGTRAELEELIAQIKKDYPDYAALRYPEAVTVAQLPLLENERVLEHQVTEDATYLFVVQKDKVDKFLKIPVSRKDLEEKVRRFRVAFENPDNLDKFNPHEAHELYSLLVAPGLEGVERDKHIIIVPDGSLHLLPFEALVVKAANATKTIDPATGVPSYQNITYLSDEWEVSYYQSATVLAINRTAEKKKPTWEKPLFAVADPIFSEDDPRWQEVPHSTTPLLASADTEPEGVLFPLRSAAEDAGYSFPRLPETRKEVLAIADFYGVSENTQDIRLGLAANEKVIKQTNLTPYQNVIFATHGILGTEVPYIQQ